MTGRRRSHRRHRASPAISAGTRKQQREVFVVMPEPDDEYATYQHHAMVAALAGQQATTTEKEGPVMTDPNPLLVQLQQEVHALTATVREQREALGTLRQAVLNLEQAVEELREGKAQDGDPNLEQVYAIFDRVAPVKLSYTDISDELEISRDEAWRAVARLEKAGKLQVHEKRAEGSTRTFRKWNVAQS